MGFTHVIAHINGNIILYHMLLLKLIFKGFFNFFIQDYSFTLRNPWMKFCVLVKNIDMEGTVSQISDIGPRFILMSKNGKI